MHEMVIRCSMGTRKNARDRPGHDVGT